MSTNSTSLLDTSSATDFVSLAMNLAGLTQSSKSNGNDDTDSFTSTVSSYALYSAFVGKNPLDPARYCQGYSRWARALSFTLGLDNDAPEPDDGDNMGDSDSDDPVLIGAKFTLPWQRDACDARFDTVIEKLHDAADDFVNAQDVIRDHLYSRYQSKKLGTAQSVWKDLVDAELRDLRAQNPGIEFTELDAFDNVLTDDDAFMQLYNSLGDEAAQIESDAGGAAVSPEGAEAFLAIDSALQSAIAELNNSPQLALNFQSKQRDKGTDEYSGEIILNAGLASLFGFTESGPDADTDLDRVKLLGNASVDFQDTATDDRTGGRLALELAFQPSADTSLAGSRPMRFSLAAEGKWMTNMGPQYKAQAKIVITPPAQLAALSWLEIPISVTVANRSELIDETEVRGLVGFTVDTSQLLMGMRN